MIVILSPQDCQIIELGIRQDEDNPKRRNLLFWLGWGWVTGSSLAFNLELADLWYLRDHISPNNKVGTHTGWDTLKKIYTHLRDEYCPEEGTYADRSSSQGTDTGSAEREPVGEPGQEAQSPAALPRPEDSNNTEAGVIAGLV